jgi:hypothetical protein
MITGFSLSVPDGWYPLDLTTRDAERAMHRRLMARASAPMLRKGLARFAAAMNQTLAVARQRGAMYAATTYGRCEEGVFHASVMVSDVVTPPGRESGVPAMLRRSARTGDGDGRWRGVGTVELPHAGPAVRVVGVEEVTVADVPIDFLVSHTVIPVPDSTRHLVLTGGSPNVDLGDELLEHFDLIAATFRFVTQAA